ncbi:MAG: aspartate dehydrogenase [Lachnospiraceae bacterium]|nr:aspartate dehydrogenase [Lachnospiraceae bacterium]
MFHKKIKVIGYDKDNLKPVIRSSICTGEKVAGFQNVNTKEFMEIMLIRDNKDMDEFLTTYDISVAEIKTEW